jgi:hypothetical protein
MSGADRINTKAQTKRAHNGQHKQSSAEKFCMTGEFCMKGHVDLQKMIVKNSDATTR